MKNSILVVKEKLKSLIGGFRGEIDALVKKDRELRASRMLVMTGPEPVETVIKNVYQLVARRASDWQAAHGAGLVKSASRRYRTLSDGQVRAVGASLPFDPTEPVTFAALCALMPDHVIESLTRIVRANAIASAVPFEAREKLVAEIDAAIAENERAHTDLVDAGREMEPPVELPYLPSIVDRRQTEDARATVARLREAEAAQHANPLRPTPTMAEGMNHDKMPRPLTVAVG